VQQILPGSRSLLADGMVIKGGTIGGGSVVSHGDHRIAMSFAMAGLRATSTIEIQDCENVNNYFNHKKIHVICMKKKIKKKSV
jgi:3-phosphoshikimate 1-carboxyvinyltransferase